jgi:uncharacterized membrane protein
MRLLLAIAAYVAVLGACAAVRWELWTFGTDTGTFTQVAHTAFAGFVDGPEQGTHFRFHWAPILASLYPLVAAFHSGLALQLAQIVLIGASAVPLYAIARSYTTDGRAFGYASLALLYPPLGAVAFTEFHEIAFYPALALAIVWAADRARWGWFALFAVLASGVREEACIVLAIVGLAFAAIGIAKRGGSGSETQTPGLLRGVPLEPGRLALAGAGLFAVNAGALYVYYGIVIPHVGAWEPSRFYEYSFAHGPAQVLAAIALHPQNAAQLVTFGRFTYLLEALVPLAFLPLFSRWSLLAIPGLLVVLLSSDPIAWRMGSHYAAIWVPWLLLASIAALLRVESAGYGARARRWFTASVAVCVVFLLAINPMHPAHYLRPIYPHTDVARALALVPADAHLLTHDEWFAHAAYAHPNATVFFCPYVDYILFADDYPGGYYRDAIVPEMAREIERGRVRGVARFSHVVLYARRPTPGAVGTCVTPGNVKYVDLPHTLGTLATVHH